MQLLKSIPKFSLLILVIFAVITAHVVPGGTSAANQQQILAGKHFPWYIDSTNLKEWTSNYKQNMHQSPITTSAMVKLDDLKRYLALVDSAYAGKNIDGFKIYFIRYTAKELAHDRRYEYTWDGHFSQVSLLFVPTNNYKVDTINGQKRVRADACRLKDGTFMTFPLGYIWVINEGTGLCPPNCGGGFGNP